MVPSRVRPGLHFPAVSLQGWGLEILTARGPQTPSSYRSVALITEIMEIWETHLLAPTMQSAVQMTARGEKRSAGTSPRSVLSCLQCWCCSGVLGMDPPLNPSTKTGGPTSLKVINPPLCRPKPTGKTGRDVQKCDTPLKAG